jgi:hypothetical protein
MTTKLKEIFPFSRCSIILLAICLCNPNLHKRYAKETALMEATFHKILHNKRLIPETSSVACIPDLFFPQKTGITGSEMISLIRRNTGIALLEAEFLENTL